jgi:type IV secretory pathway VirJ component
MMVSGITALFSLALAGHLAPASPPRRQADTVRADTVRFGRFGPVVLYHRAADPHRVVLLVSGDGGWNLGVVNMAREIAGMDALVVGIDVRYYRYGLAAAPERCSYAAADFEALSQSLQRRMAFPRYIPPILLGYSSGATLAYATLVQAPPGTFAGAVSLGFCPDLLLPRPLCRGNGLAWEPGPAGRGFSFSPAEHLSDPWVVLQGERDAACPPSRAIAFAGKVRGAETVLLPDVGHGFSVTGHWTPQLRDVLARMGRAAVAPPPAAPAVADLPLVELPVRGSQRLAVIVSGDGGWASLDRQIGEALSGAGISVVGLNSLQCFWHRRTPEGAAADLGRIIRHCLPAWHASELVLVGFSRGADVLPFMVSRLPADLRSKVRLVALLGVSHQAQFEFHLSDLIGATRDAKALATVPEIRRLRGTRVLCVYGTEETDSACRDLPSDLATGVGLPGGHHFGGAYRAIAARILREAGGARQD